MNFEGSTQSRLVKLSTQSRLVKLLFILLGCKSVDSEINANTLISGTKLQQLIFWSPMGTRAICCISFVLTDGKIRNKTCLYLLLTWYSPEFDFSALTLNVRGPSYLGLTRSISWLLMSWLLTSPGHQKPWYWLCRIGRFLSYLRKDFNYLRRINVEIWHKM